MEYIAQYQKSDNAIFCKYHLMFWSTHLCCVSADEGCGKYYYKKQNGCVSFEEGCGEGWLEKNRECIEASEGCGENYKDLGGWCNRVIYTPAEAAEVLNDENNMVTITFRK